MRNQTLVYDANFSSFFLSFYAKSKTVEDKLFKRKPGNYTPIGDNTFRITLEILLSNLKFTYDLISLYSENKKSFPK